VVVGSVTQVEKYVTDDFTQLRASMLEKKGTDYKLYLKTEPQSELRSELGKYLQEFSF
jgi:hypothetical protein